MNQIKNIIFDVGNVLVKWVPENIIISFFPKEDPKEFLKKIYPIFMQWSLGHITQDEVVVLCAERFHYPVLRIKDLIHEFIVSQTPIEGSVELLYKLDQAGYPLYAITDNTKEAMEFHKQNSHFLPYFKDIICSADVEVLKPNPRIYQILLDRNHLKAEECLFIDDLEENVQGAQAVGMQAHQFTNAASCELYIKSLILNPNH